VILDEAHTIKNKSTDNAKACFAITSRNKWAVTGTPI
jgi:DNA repair protein RAD5